MAEDRSGKFQKNLSEAAERFELSRKKQESKFLRREAQYNRHLKNTLFVGAVSLVLIVLLLLVLIIMNFKSPRLLSED